MHEYIEVDFPEKIKRLFDAGEIDPVELVERALNRMTSQIPIIERRSHLRLVTWESP